MRIWRRDRRKVVGWMDNLINLRGQAGAALEPKTQKKFWILYKQAQALKKKIDANQTMKVKTFTAWMVSQRRPKR